MRHSPIDQLAARMLHVVLTASLLAATALVAAVAPARADSPLPVLDQAFTTPSNAITAIDECCRYVAQTFTAGITGALTAINVDIASLREYPLHFAIHGVTNGLPDATILGESNLWTDTDHPIVNAPLTLQILVGPPVYVVAGKQYAIVVNYDGTGSPGLAAGNWSGASGDAYAGGAAFMTNDESFATWTSAGASDLDLHFKAYVVPNVPVSDLSIKLASMPRHAKACQTFDMTYRLTNNGPDTAHNVMLSIGLWDQFDAIAIDGVPVGQPRSGITLAPGESALMTATIKVTAFVPGGSRQGLISGYVWSDDSSTIPLDPNSANDGVDYMLHLIGRQVMSCPQ